jgi:hypothetical protein
VIDPGAIPRFQGDVDALEADASTLKGVGQGVRATGADVDSTWQGLAAFYEAPEAARLFAATGPVRSRADDLGDDVVSVAGTLSGYAAEVRPIAARLDALRVEAASFVQNVADDDDWREDGGKVDQHNGLLTQVDQQVLALQDAERTAANAINALFGGRQWHAGGSDAGTYGPTVIPADAERPWGAPEQKDEPWWKDVVNGGVSLVKGFVVDGLWEDVMGLVGFINPFDWDKFSASWGGLWTLTGKLFYAPGEWAEGWKNLGKALVAWDMWSQDPARAFGTVLFNVVTLPLAALKALKAGKAARLGKAGTADDVADAVADTGKLPDGARLTDQLADAGKLDPALPTVGDLARQLDAGTPEVRVGDLDSAAGRVDEATTPADEVAGTADDVPARDREPVPVGAREAADDAAGSTRADEAPGAGPVDDAAGQHGDDVAGQPGDEAVGDRGDLGDHGGAEFPATGGDDLSGGWVGEGGGGEQLRLNPIENADANVLLDRAWMAEPRLTDSMTSIRDDIDGAELVGLDARLKTEDSLKRNFATELLDPGSSYAGALDTAMRDAVRYTLQLPDGSYAAGVRQAAEQLQARGFEPVTFRNFWGAEGYQGINSTWRDPVTGQVFEVQFHTAQSFAAKTETHALYDQIRLPGTPRDEVTRLERAQAEVFDQVPLPPGAADVRLPQPPN